MDNLRELVSVAAEFEEQRAQTDDAADLDAFLEHVSLVADADSVPDASGGVVTLMTLHTAKGLEFPVVFLTGLEDGIFPHQRTFGEPGEMAEERRLAYVGITRARQRLYLSRAVARTAWGQPKLLLAHCGAAPQRFSTTARVGAALHSDRPSLIVLPSSTPGRLLIARFTPRNVATAPVPRPTMPAPTLQRKPAVSVKSCGGNIVRLGQFLRVHPHCFAYTRWATEGGSLGARTGPARLNRHALIWTNPVAVRGRRSWNPPSD